MPVSCDAVFTPCDAGASRDALSRAFQYDQAQEAYPMCTEPTGDGVALSKALIEKYSPLLEG